MRSRSFGAVAVSTSRCSRVGSFGCVATVLTSSRLLVVTCVFVVAARSCRNCAFTVDPAFVGGAERRGSYFRASSTTCNERASRDRPSRASCPRRAACGTPCSSGPVTARGASLATRDGTRSSRTPDRVCVGDDSPHRRERRRIRRRRGR